MSAMLSQMRNVVAACCSIARLRDTVYIEGGCVLNVRKLVQYLLIRFPRQDIITNEAKHKHSYCLEGLCVSVIEMVN